MSVAQDSISTFSFAGKLPPDARRELMAGAMRQALPAGTDLLHPGDLVDGAYLVHSGAIRVYYIDPSGREGTLYWIEPGQSCILALNALFREIPYPAWAAAGEEGVDLSVVPGAVFRSLFSREPAVQSYLFEQLTNQVFTLLQRLEITMSEPQEKRLARILLDQADGENVVRLSQDRLARHLGTLREVVSRHLRSLAAQGLIALAPRRIVLADRPRLERLVAGPDEQRS